MRVMFISFKWFINDYSKKMQVDAVRINEYYNNFKRIYGSVDFFYITDDGLLSNEKGVFQFDKSILDQYDIVFFYHEATIERIIKNNDRNKVLDFISTKPSFIQIDCANWSFTKETDIMSLFKSVGVAHPGAYNKIDHNDKHLIYNATIDRINPVDINQLGDIVYIGRVCRVNKIKDKLIEFSKKIKTNINLYTFDECGEDLGKEEFITFKGDLKYNEIGDALNGCSYGLCFYDNESPCGKVFDYLSYGVPVLYEYKIGENNLINDSMGMSFDFDNLESISLTGDYFKSEDIFKNVNENHLWENRVQIWNQIIKNKK
jgi:hypothetical protein